MRDEDIGVRIVRLRRVLAGAQRRHARRHSRSSTIWYLYKDCYGRYPGRSSRIAIYDVWDHKKRSWIYEDAYLLELEAAILMNWVTVLLYEAMRLRDPVYRRRELAKLA